MNDAVKPKIKSKQLPVEWGELRAQASKLGLALSEFQQQEKQRKLRLEKTAIATGCYLLLKYVPIRCLNSQSMWETCVPGENWISIDWLSA